MTMLKPRHNRFAIFSDVHANLPALRAVLADIDKQGIEDCYCLGDVVDFAPWPNEVIDLLKARHIPVVYGNHDERVAFDKAISPMPWHSEEEQAARIAGINISKATVSAENMAWLRTLPMSLSLSVGSGDNPFHLLLVHASPHSVSEYIYADYDAALLAQMSVQYQYDAMVTGHTHCAYIRQLPGGYRGDFSVANCGAVGRIKPGQPQATWLYAEVSDGKLKMSIKRVNYDVAAVAQAIVDSNIPDFYARELYHHGLPSLQALSGK